MKAFTAVMTVLAIPFVLLNTFGVFAGGVWLAILGKWSTIFVGIGIGIGATMLLSFALMPGILMVFPAAKLAEKRIYSGSYILMLIGSGYTWAVIGVWCVAVMWFFMKDATAVTLKPLLLWSYGVATAPLGSMVAGESENTGGKYIVLFASFAYITAGLWDLFGEPTVLNVLVVFASFMGIGCLLMVALAIAVSKYSEGS